MNAMCYLYGCYTFPVKKNGRIKGLCNTDFANEAELLRAYDSACAGVGLIRVNVDNTETVLREKVKA